MECQQKKMAMERMLCRTIQQWYLNFWQMHPHLSFTIPMPGFPMVLLLFEEKPHKCCVYIANESKYCSRLNSIQAFSGINRDVVGDANHLLSGYSFSAQNNIIHPSALLGSKTTVGPQYMVGEGSKMGDKCSVKKSVIGRHCRIGSNVKIADSVVMNYVTIGDGSSIQGSIICSNVQLQERAILKDCQVGAGFVVTTGSEYKGEWLAKKEKQ